MPSGPAEVIEDDGRVGERAREARQLGDLRVVEPGVEAQPAPAELGEARGGSARRREGRAADSCASCAPGRSRPSRRRGGCRESAGSPPCGRRAPGRRASPSVRSAKLTMPAATRVGRSGRSRLIAATPLTNSVSPTGRMAVGAVGAVHRHALDEHRGRHVVPAAGVGDQLVDQVAPARDGPTGDGAGRRWAASGSRMSSFTCASHWSRSLALPTPAS